MGVGYGRPPIPTSYTPQGGIAATTLAAAVTELDTEKAAAVHAHTGTYAPIGVTTIAASGASQALNVGLKSDFEVTLTGSTTFTTTNWPTGTHAVVIHWTQGGAGNFSPTFTGVVWEDGEAPIFDGTVGSEGLIVLRSTDSGTTVRGFHGQSRLMRCATWYTQVGVDLTTQADSNAVWFRRASRIAGVKINSRVAPVGASILVDINYGATIGSLSTIFSTQGNRPAIAAASQESTFVTNANVKNIAAGGYLTANIDQVGIATKGQGLTIQVFFFEG